MAVMFILYAVVAGLIVGLLSGGSPARLGDLRFAWAPLIALGMAAQVVLFSTPVGDALGPAAPILYVASNVAVLAAVARNLAIPGFALVVAGGASPAQSDSHCIHCPCGPCRASRCSVRSPSMKLTHAPAIAIRPRWSHADRSDNRRSMTVRPSLITQCTSWARPKINAHQSFIRIVR